MKAHESEMPRAAQTKAHLDVYVADDCGSCNESRRLAELITGRCPRIRVRIVNLSEPETGMPERVVAVPTFVLNDEVLHLGNPREDWLLRELEQSTSTKYAGGLGYGLAGMPRTSGAMTPSIHLKRFCCSLQ